MSTGKKQSEKESTGTESPTYHIYPNLIVPRSLPKGDKGKSRQSDSRTLLEALAAAIDGTDVQETMRLAAEFNSSFGDLVRASIGPESVVAPEEELRRDTTQRNTHEAWHNNLLASKASQAVETENTVEAPKDDKKGKPRRSGRAEAPEEAEILDEADTKAAIPRTKKKMREPDSSSDDSSNLKPKKKKNKRKAQRKKDDHRSDSSSASPSDSGSTSSEDDDSDDSDDDEKAELCYDVTNFESADLLTSQTSGIRVFANLDPTSHSLYLKRR